MPHKKVHSLAFVGGRNEFRGKVKEIIDHGPFVRVVLCMQCECKECEEDPVVEDTITAIITKRRKTELDIQEGMNIRALIGCTSVQLEPERK
jgi:molybdopterin-binding protein